jgi:ribosome biogenesis protein Nip4
LKQLNAFALRFGTQVALNPEFIVEKRQRYYLLNPALRKIGLREFFYAGQYLGKVKDGVFFPSFNFLNMLIPAAANKVILEPKAAWLFICSRDIFRKGIAKMTGSHRRGDFTLVMNEWGECLGFGVVAGGLEPAEGGKVAVRNVLDIGDFLRREF